MINLLRLLWNSKRGATAIEYGLIVALIAIAASAFIALFADAAIAMWEFIKTNALDNL